MTVALVPAALDVGIRPWGLSDAAELAAMYTAAAADLAVEEPWCGSEFLTPAGQRERVRRCLDDHTAEGFVITVAGAIAGHLSLARIRGDILDSADIGYWVAPCRRGHGIATRAIGLAAVHAFELLGLRRLHATTGADNLASRRALEANGFQMVGVTHDLALVGGGWGDGCLYQLTAAGWLVSRPSRRTWRPLPGSTGPCADG
jgi:ribosomal-protein-alanine N-acetyltransferase